MHLGLVIGKKVSTGLPGKNRRMILGKPAAEYAFIAGSESLIDCMYISTDCSFIASIGASYGAIHIDRPGILATPEALTEDVLLHAYNIMKREHKKIKTISLLFCNQPMIDSDRLDDAIEFLANDTEYDSCFSVVKYDMFSPARARRLSPEGEIKPFIDLSLMDNVSSIRNSQGSVYFCDLSIQVMKPICFEKMDEGQLPFKWQGKKSKAIEVDFGFDIDAEWQVPIAEYWLRKKQNVCV